MPEQGKAKKLTETMKKNRRLSWAFFSVTFLCFKFQFYLLHTWALFRPVKRFDNLTMLFKKAWASTFPSNSKWFCAAKLKGSDGGDGALLNYALARDYLCWASTSTKHSSLILGRAWVAKHLDLFTPACWPTSFYWAFISQTPLHPSK